MTDWTSRQHIERRLIENSRMIIITRAVTAGLGLTPGKYALVTLHRPSNVDDPATLTAVLEALGKVSERLPIVFPIHPRTRKSAESAGLGALLAKFRMLEPVGYREMLSLTDGAAVVLTDSGGLQEETTVLGVPCVTLREQTERPVTVTEGTNRTAPWPLTAGGVFDTFEMARKAPVAVRRPEGWDGRAAERVVRAIEQRRGPGAAGSYAIRP